MNPTDFFYFASVGFIYPFGEKLNFNAQRMNEPNGFSFMLHPLVSSIGWGKN